MKYPSRTAQHDEYNMNNQLKTIYYIREDILKKAT